jgi:hypothetical protein
MESGVDRYNGDGELTTSAERNAPTGKDMDSANYKMFAVDEIERPAR